MNNTGSIFIHATNVTGLGASHVAGSLIRSLGKLAAESRFDCYLPAIGALAEAELDGGNLIPHPFPRRLPNSVSRLLECFFSRAYFPTYELGITLGDIPLRNVAHQVVLIHRPHLVFRTESEEGLSLDVMRWLFRKNLSYGKKFVVQTDVIGRRLERRYPEVRGKVVVVPQPPPDWFRGEGRPQAAGSAAGMTLFYPAAGYPHKNHRILNHLAPGESAARPFKEIIITLREDEARDVDCTLPWIKNVDRLSPEGCLETYRRVDALFFPSLAESYGLPLVEAMVMGLPVVCADLPYAHWLCADQALYFDPADPAAAREAIAELDRRRLAGWRPDWSRALARIPKSWNEVGARFLELLSER
jgi:glycosyltransferase involved in cell wall biosynthesis